MLSPSWRIRPVHLLAGIAAAPISSKNLQEGLRWSLHFLCRTFGADDGEVLLINSSGNELSTFACVGRDQHLLLQRDRFKAGEGYPGIAYAERQPLASRDICQDQRFLRREALSSSGIRTFISVPLVAPEGSPVGCMSLAWRRDDLQIKNLCDVLQLVSHSLGNIVASVFKKEHKSSSTFVAQTQKPRLEIKCLGRFEVRIHGQLLSPHTFVRRRALTLLKILVLHAGRPLHRERLIEWLWPGEEPEHIRLNRLYGIIHSLRMAIEPEAHKERWVYVLTQGENYWFDHQRSEITVDLLQFKEMIALAEKSRRHELRFEEVISPLVQAVELYQGELFEDDLYAEWCQAERSLLQKEVIDAFVTLAQLLWKTGETGRAMNYIRLAIKVEPFREDLHYSLVTMLLKMDRHQEALEQCMNCFRLLKDELDVQPAAEFKRLYQDIQSRRTTSAVL